MNILVACEESQAVTIALRAKGHTAFSCDIQDCSGGHSEWHIKDDVTRLLDGRCEFLTADGDKHSISDRWDMIIAFPPCTHLAVSGTRHFERKRADGRQRKGIEFFCKFLQADCEKISIENPVNIISGEYVKKWFPDLAEKYGLPIKSTQIIDPWQFGADYTKKTCLWLKGLNKLQPKITEMPEMKYHEWTDKRTGKKKRQNVWYYQSERTSNGFKGSVDRSKTYPGVAEAMAEQWG